MSTWGDRVGRKPLYDPANPFDAVRAAIDQAAFDLVMWAEVAFDRVASEVSR